MLSPVPRFYRADLRLPAFGAEYAEISIEEVRAQTAFVFEEAVLFSAQSRTTLMESC